MDSQLSFGFSFSFVSHHCGCYLYQNLDCYLHHHLYCDRPRHHHLDCDVSHHLDCDVPHLRQGVTGLLLQLLRGRHK